MDKPYNKQHQTNEFSFVKFSFIDFHFHRVQCLISGKNDISMFQDYFTNANIKEIQVFSFINREGTNFFKQGSQCCNG